jgi:hypothetical protein
MSRLMARETAKTTRTTLVPFSLLAQRPNGAACPVSMPNQLMPLILSGTSVPLAEMATRCPSLLW